MIRHIAPALGLVILVSSRASASSVLVTASGDATFDSSVVNMLTSYGHSVTLGPEWHTWDGSFDLVPFETVYLQTNYNWGHYMPLAGQSAFVDYVSGGGGLVTTEWLTFQMGTQVPYTMPILEAILPGKYSGTYRTAGPATYTRSTPHTVLNAGLPDSFSFEVTFVAGTETLINAKAGATVFYIGDFSPAGLVGWSYGSGRVLSFSTVNADAQIADPNFSRLISNSVTFLAVPEPTTLIALAGGIGLLVRRRRK